MPALTRIELEVAAPLWRDLLERMAAQRSAGEETLGFLLCGATPLGSRGVRLHAEDLRVPGRADFHVLGRAGLELAQDWHLEHLLDPLLAGRTLVQIHSHPGKGQPRFSATDDRDERRYAAFLQALPGKRRRFFVSGVLSEDYASRRFRAWRAGAVRPLDQVQLRVLPAVDERLDRQRVFGEGFRAALESLRVCLVGCGGLGAVVAEQLARLGVRRWVLVDPDRVEASNLNRLPAGTTADARSGRLKVDYAAGLIRTFWEDRAELDLRPCALEEAMREERLPACDWLILATDNHSSRLRALELWRRWDCRLLNLATDIQVREGGARMWARVTLLPRDRSWCLVCAEAVSAEEAAREEAGPDLRERLRREGYLTGVKAPAVYHLNGLCASWGVGLLHQALLDGGLAEGRDLLLNPVDSLLMEVEPPARGCWHCAPGEAAAAPDSLPRLTLPAGPGRSMEEGRTARRGPGGGARGL